ncbi:bifunctional DNA primase/polymerase [Bradyrhizobium jicamae]|uniref:Bifunctional DNA primase/polymerase n=1 Tax=Bradyrhizobium jicamae TaxID=280332 RepID=A0ABS5FQ66_9BRAD|nr:bifunctional DNA primase/polymerase [Bradyrhizobium jicamae]MBR0798949.1 bifunctional DNA primase/polymerase [Bradyrhizobium jicamae]
MSISGALAAALIYIAKGVPVFPCRPDKKPFVAGGFKAASFDPRQVKEWWRQWPNAMIGLPTGNASGIAVLDIDKKGSVDGFVELPDWQTRSNVIVSTPSGGAHLYFRCGADIRSSASQIAPGLDVRGEGGYVIVPPSGNGVGVYRFEKGDIGDELLPFPADLTEKKKEARTHRAAPRTSAARSWSKADGSGDDGVTSSPAALCELETSCRTVARAGEGQRNQILNTEAFKMGQLVGNGRIVERLVGKRLTNAARETGLGEEEIAKTIASGLAAGIKLPRLPKISIVAGKIADTIDAAEAELIASGQPVFQRGGFLVQPVTRELPATDGKKTEATVLRRMTSDNVTYALNRHAAEFEKYDARRKRDFATNPPDNVTRGLLGKGQWDFPCVSGVLTVPTMRPNGTIIDSPGYDTATGLHYSPDAHLKLPPLKSDPTLADAEGALKRLQHLLLGFPLVSDLDRSVAIAALMMPVLRGAYDVCPLILMSAHAAGSGKSYLVDLAATIVGGRQCPVITSVPKPDEMEKRLGALILEGVPIVSLDNCSHDLGGDLLCQVVERPIVRIRILSKSEVPECEWRGTLYATGNNIGLKGDMTRRGLVCHLDAGVERPELRKFNFDPVAQVLANRGTYINDLLTISRAYRVAGAPKVCGPIGSYGQWSTAVRAPLVWLGLEDPVKSMETAREEDPVRSTARTLFALWKEHLGTKTSYSAADVIRISTEMVQNPEIGSGPSWVPNRPELHDLLMLRAGDGKRIDGNRLGGWLRTLWGQVHDGYKLERVRDDAKHGHRYALVEAMPTKQADGDMGDMRGSSLPAQESVKVTVSR